MSTVLTIIRNAWFSWDCTVVEGGRPIADISLARWRDDGVLTVEGVAYRARREGRMSGDYLLEVPGATVARATSSGMFRRSFTIAHDGEHYELRRRSFFGRALVLRKGDREVGSVSRMFPFSRQASAELPTDLPLPVKVFIVWLAVVAWRRAARAAAS